MEPILGVGLDSFLLCGVAKLSWGPGTCFLGMGAPCCASWMMWANAFCNECELQAAMRIHFLLSLCFSIIFCTCAGGSRLPLEEEGMVDKRGVVRSPVAMLGGRRESRTHLCVLAGLLVPATNGQEENLETGVRSHLRSIAWPCRKQIHVHELLLVCVGKCGGVNYPGADHWMNRQSGYLNL